MFRKYIKEEDAIEENDLATSVVRLDQKISTVRKRCIKFDMLDIIKVQQLVSKGAGGMMPTFGTTDTVKDLIIDSNELTLEEVMDWNEDVIY